MKFWDYIKDKIMAIIAVHVSVFLSSLLLWILEINVLYVKMNGLIFLFMFWLCILADFFRRKKFYKDLLNTFEETDQKNLFSEIMENGDFTEAKILKYILEINNKYMCDELEKYRKENKEYQEYVELWVHEIKTPITSSLLLIENDINITTISIRDELYDISRYVEQALFYARSTALEKDFRLEQVQLNELVVVAVKAHSKPIIKVGGDIKFDNLKIDVLADKKWCQFIIEQIISNSVKYRKEHLQITFCGNAEGDMISLSIIDNGMGIPQEDVEKVFQKGFVGKTGRKYVKSTGLGLYLCKRLCEKMNMNIEIDSKYGEWTQIKLHFISIESAKLFYRM